MSAKILSKSRLLRGLQCTKNLYFSIYHPELEQAPSESQERIFDDGTKVGELAREQFPGGTLIEAEHFDLTAFVEKTKAAIADGSKAIYEAGFAWDGFFFRADILKQTGNKWDLIEVKMTTSVKDVHLEDLAIQKIIAEGAGIKIRKTVLMHLNSKCIFPDLSNLFVQNDASAEVEDVKDEVHSRMKELKKISATNNAPKTDIGPHCSDPYECAFQSHCWQHVPTPSIFDIPKIKPWKFYEQGKVTIRSIQDEDLSATAKRAVKAHLNGKRFVDRKAIQEALSEWQWPLTFLDFETIAYTIPRLNGCSPYSQVPFQVACSVWESEQGKLEVFDYLNVDDEDPRNGMAEHLARVIPETGNVVAYNKGFESGVLSKLADHSPKLKKTLQAIQERLVDPLPIFRASIYDPGFGSSFSIKYVAPSILGSGASYSALEVKDGGEAQTAYLKVRDPSTAPAERARLKTGLENYCRQDTELMRQLVAWLLENSGAKGK